MLPRISGCIARVTKAAPHKAPPARRLAARSSLIKTMLRHAMTGPTSPMRITSAHPAMRLSMRDRRKNRLSPVGTNKAAISSDFTMKVIPTGFRHAPPLVSQV